MLKPLLFFFAVSCASPPEPAPRPVAPRPVARPSHQAVDAAVYGLAWDDLILRDKTLAFSPRAGMEALADLTTGELGDADAAIALLAYGASKRPGSVEYLREKSQVGSFLIRRAAMLALGEGGGVEGPILAQWMDNSELELREAALLAGLVGGAPIARELAEKIVDQGEGQTRDSVERILEFVTDRDASEDAPVARWYLELRYAAAKRYGLIDGASWSALVMDQVVRDSSFLDELVLDTATQLFANGVDDHLMHELLEGTGTVRIGAAAKAMPAQVSALVETELWEPRDRREWDALLDAIWSEALEPKMGAVLVRALDFPDHRQRASASIARLEDKEIARVFQPTMLDVEHATPDEREWAIEYLLALGDDDAPEKVRQFLEDEDRVVRAKARVALLRLSVSGLEAEVIDLFAVSGNEDRDQVLEELCLQARSAGVSKVLHELMQLEVLDSRERVLVGANLILSGRSAPQLTFIDDIGEVSMSGELGALILRALGRRGLAEDLELLVEQFPMEGEREMNLAAARELVRRGMPEALPVLQAAMWRGPWDRSILACAIMVERFGFRTLTDELERPPAKATSEDLRRVGFALGEWGGLEELEAFARRLRTSSGDPILQGALLGALSARTH